MPRGLEIFRQLVGRKRLYENVFKAGDGPWVLQDIIRSAHMFEPTAVKNGKLAPDGMSRALENEHREGERSVALRILTILGYDEQRIMLMAEQAQENDDG